MKPHQYAEATWLSRRMQMNSILTIVAVCALSIGSMALPLHAEQMLLNRIMGALTVALASPAR